MQPSSYSDTVRRLREIGSFADDAAAAEVLHATLRALGGVLGSGERESLCRALPPELASSVQEPSPGGPGRAREFFLDVSLHAGVRIGLAIQYASMVCRVLGEIMTPSARARLAHALPEIGELLQPPEEPAKVPNSERSARRAEAALEPELNPETKRSAACGLEEERVARRLARARRRRAAGGARHS
jgi:uncharacterized protein (DUF2267 family)